MGLLRRYRGAIVRLGAAVVLLGGAVYWAAPFLIPLPPGIGEPPGQGLVLADRHGQPLRRLVTGDGMRADRFASFPEIPSRLVQATLAAEDKRFFRHRGVDFLALGRAVRDGIARGRIVSGASTISQQLIKLASPPRKRHPGAKVMEILAARRLELSHDKETILAAYLNRLPYGNQVTGCRAAARFYFDKPLEDLSLAEAAFLAGLPNQPGRLNPYRNFQGAKQRQLWILGRMMKEGMIDAETHRLACREELQLSKERPVFQAPHFVDLLLRTEPELAKSAGRTVLTSLDLELQQAVEAIAANILGNAHHDGHVAVVVIENKSGEILSLTGSRSFFDSEGGQINGAWTPRSAGSTLKPFTYLLALEKGYTAAAILPDVPVEYVSPAGAFQPVNFNRHFNGPVSLRHALANSLNVPAVRVLNEIGGPVVLHRLLRQDLGFSSLGKEGASYGLGLTIGNAEVRLVELANAYACLARMGKALPWRLRPAPDEQGTLPRRTLFTGELCWILADILADDAARTPAFGFHSPLNLPFPVAAKTGTSTDYRDNWTLGFTPDYTVGVWMGRFDNKPIPGKLTGGSGAALIFREVMLRLYADRKAPWYDRPAGVVSATVDALSGKRLDPDLAKRLGPSRTRNEWFLQGALPPPASAADYDPDGRTLLPATYQAWWESEDNRLRDVAAIVPQERQGFRITSPMNETRAFIDPDLPGAGRKFALKIEGSGRETIEWRCQSLEILEEKGRSWILLQPGRHVVEAIDRASGWKQSASFSVEEL